MGEPNKITIPLHALVGESSKDVEEEEWFGDRVANALNELIDENYTRGFALGCIVGAAIVAWGDAMRGMVRRARALEWAKARDPDVSVLAQGECEYSESGGKRGCEGSTIETAHAWLWSPRYKDDRCEDCGILGAAFDALSRG